MDWGQEALDALVDALASSGAPVVGAALGSADDLVVRTSPAADADRRFEIGSVTKTMTATVLAWLVGGGDLALDAPIGTWIDTGSNAAAATITLEELATHTSGLPRLAPNFDAHPAFDPRDPYARFEADDAEKGAAATEDLSGRGKFLYSNFGYQLLGVCLERATSSALSDLLAEIVWDPLELKGAAVDRPGVEVDAIEGTRRGVPVARWAKPLLGSGGVLAPLADVARYGCSFVDPPPGRLGEALRVTTSARPNGRPGLAWQEQHDVLWHDGGTSGFRSMLVVDLTRRRCVTAFAADSDCELVRPATLSAAVGGDPRHAVPQPIGPDVDTARWTDVAVAALAAFEAGDFPRLRALPMTDGVRALLTDDTLATVRASTIETLGDTRTPPSVTAVVRKGRYVEVTVSIGVVAVVTFDDLDVIAGLMIR